MILTKDEIKQHKMLRKRNTFNICHINESKEILNARLISYDCGHYIHHYKSSEMCEEIIKFVNSMKE